MSTISTSEFNLTPKLYGPLAQWPLRGAPNVGALCIDSTGNGRALANAQEVPNPAPDGLASACMLYGRLVSPADPALQLLGDVTVTVRAWARFDLTPPGQMAFTMNDGTDVNGLWDLIIYTDGTIGVAIETTPNLSHIWKSNLSIPWGVWAYYSMRHRASDNSWRVGINGAFDSTTTLPVTTITGSPKLYVGGSDVPSPPWFWQGGLVDLSIWDQYLSDAQINNLRSKVGL